MSCVAHRQGVFHDGDSRRILKGPLPFGAQRGGLPPARTRGCWLSHVTRHLTQHQEVSASSCWDIPAVRDPRVLLGSSLGNCQRRFTQDKLDIPLLIKLHKSCPDL